MDLSEIREHVFRMLFRVEFHDQSEYEEQMALYTAALSGPTQSELEFLRDRALKIIDKLDELDAAISDKVIGWRIERIGRVELTLIRLALYEIRYDDHVPVGVAINEAVELAKRYGDPESGAFVNGVLARLV